MIIKIAEYCGFCFGVKKAVDTAFSYAALTDEIDSSRRSCDEPQANCAACPSKYCPLTAAKSQDDKRFPLTYTYGELIHNEYIISKLKIAGIDYIDSLEGINHCNLIIRSHGAPKSLIDEVKTKNINLIDATCPFVKKIHLIVEKYSSLGYKIVIFGQAHHPEVIGINGWCNNSALVVDDENALLGLNSYEKVCVVAQTTFSIEKFEKFVKIISKHYDKILEIFDTICYTTYKRQSEAILMAQSCDVILVIGSKKSSNTTKLYNLCQEYAKRTFHIENVTCLKNINFFACDTIGIVAGASTPTELIMEVKGYMNKQFSDVQNEEFINAVKDEKHVSYKPGKRVKCTVISADEKGVHIVLGGKLDGLIHCDEMSIDGTYNVEDYKPGDDIDAVIINKKDEESNCVLLSKKQVDKIKEGDKFVETIRNGEEFELLVEKEIKGGLLGKMGTYSIFVPASQIKETFVKDLKIFVGKKLRVTAIEINDIDHKIVASQRRILEKERIEKEEIFWTHVQPNVLVNGKVKRVTNFGAFVSVDGFDCLAHIVDLSWNRIKNVEEVLKINDSYDFLVLNVDKEKGRVSLGYKQLQPHPFVSAMEKYPIGSVIKGKVVRLVPFGAFVELEPGIDGLVHVSEAAHSFVKNINEILKVDDIIDAKVMNIDEASRKITLSIKACTENPQPQNDGEQEFEQNQSGAKPAKTFNNNKKPQRNTKSDDNDSAKEWSEDLSNNPFADLLKDLDL